MQRFCVGIDLSHRVNLEDQKIVHQISRVMRAKVGDRVIFFSGKDQIDHVYEIEGFTKNQISLLQVESMVRSSEPSKSVTLYQSLPNKYEKIEYIIEKGIEVGISSFVFFRTDFSQKLIVSPQKKERFDLIAREALEQCGGSILPSIEWIDHFPTEFPKNSLILHTSSIPGNMKNIKDLSEISVFVGPEGGFSPREIEKMESNGSIFVHFGERILRTETAGVVTAFWLLHQ